MTEMETPAVPEPQSLDAGTDYLGFQRVKTNDPAAGDWKQIGGATARTPKLALETIVGRLPEGQRQGTFVAIAAKFWQPVQVSEKVERTLVIGS